MGFTTAKRTWTVQRHGRTYRVEMEDEYFFGSRVIRVDGNVAYTGRTILSDHSGSYQFDLGGEPAFLKIRTNGFRYYYDLVAEPSVALESRGRPSPSAFAQSSPSLIGGAGLAAVAVAMAAVLVWIGDGRVWREPPVAIAGIPVDAIVTRATTSIRDSRRIEYRFQVRSETFVHEGFVSDEKYERARSLGIVPVRYLAIAPEINAFAPEAGDVIFDVIVGVVLAATSASFLLSAAQVVSDYRIWRRLSLNGVETVGRVTRVHTLRNRYMLAVGSVVEYTYEPAGSAEFRGRSGGFPLDAALHYPVGSAVRIRYDPDQPRDSILLTSNI